MLLLWLRVRLVCFRDGGYEALAHESLCKPSCAYATPLGISKPALQTFVVTLPKSGFLTLSMVLMTRYRYSIIHLREMIVVIQRRFSSLRLIQL